MKEALAIVLRDLDEAERIAAADRLAIPAGDEDAVEGRTAAEEPATSSKPKKQKKDVEDSVLVGMRKKFADAQPVLTSVKDALTATQTRSFQNIFTCIFLLWHFIYDLLSFIHRGRRLLP